MATVEPSTFGSLLRRHRLAAGLTQAELAERAGISVRSVSDLERLAKRPHPYTVSCLADALLLGSRERTELEASLRRSRTFPHTQEAAVPRGDGVRVDGGGFPLLVGRDRELGLIQRQLGFETMGADALLNERPSMLVLTGEPGIGKSRLLAEASRLARASGWQMLSGGCVRRSGAQPYAPFVDLLALTITQSSPAQQQHDLAGCSWLVRLLPELAETRTVPSPQWQLPPEQERRLIFAAVGRYLHNIAGPSGTLLLLDDLQWAGQDTLDLLDVLARGTLSDIRDIARQSNTLAPGDDARAVAPVRMIVACRDTELRPDHPFAMLVADLAREGRADIHQLEPLSPQEAGELARSLLDIGSMQEEADAPTSACMPDELATTLAQRTGGRPYFLMSCAQAVRAARAVRASWDASQDAAWGVPWNVSASIHQRVAALPGAAQDLLSAAAIAGRHASRGVLLQVGVRLEIAIPDLLAALEALDRARLLLAVGPDSYEFAHDLVREVVAADLSSARGAVLHGWIAEALETGAKHKPHPAELAWHFQQAGEPMRALPYALAAGDQAAAVCAHAEAEAHYRTALELAQGGGDAAREAEALEKLGVILYLLSRYDEAFELFDMASRSYRSSDNVEREGRIAFQMSLVCVRWGRAEEGLRRLLLFLDADRAKALPLPITVQLFSMKSLLLEAPDQLEESLRAAEHTDSLAQSIVDSSAQAQAAFQRGQALEPMGRSDEALACFGRAISLAENAKSLLDLQVLVRAYNHCAGIQSERGDWAQSAMSYEAAKAYADQLGDPLLSAMITVDQGLVAFRLGNWRLAHEYYEKARQIYQAVGTSAKYYMPRFTWCIGVLCFAEGRQEEANRWFYELLALVSNVPIAVATQFTPRVAWSRALDHLLQGRPELACAQLEPFRDLQGLEYGDVIGAILEIPVLLAWAFLQLGRESDARMELTRSAARARTSHERMEVWRIRAMIAMRQGSWQEGETSLEEALALARAMPYPYAEAKTLYLYGQLYTGRGEPEQAREKYEQALAICERLGEGLYRPHLERALAALQENVRAQ